MSPAAASRRIPNFIRSWTRYGGCNSPAPSACGWKSVAARKSDPCLCTNLSPQVNQDLRYLSGHLHFRPGTEGELASHLGPCRGTTRNSRCSRARWRRSSSSLPRHRGAAGACGRTAHGSGDPCAERGKSARSAIGRHPLRFLAAAGAFSASATATPGTGSTIGFRFKARLHPVDAVLLAGGDRRHTTDAGADHPRELNTGVEDSWIERPEFWPLNTMA